MIIENVHVLKFLLTSFLYT